MIALRLYIWQLIWWCNDLLYSQSVWTQYNKTSFLQWTPTLHRNLCTLRSLFSPIYLKTRKYNDFVEQLRVYLTVLSLILKSWFFSSHKLLFGHSLSRIFWLDPYLFRILLLDFSLQFCCKLLNFTQVYKFWCECILICQMVFDICL